MRDVETTPDGDIPRRPALPDLPVDRDRVLGLRVPSRLVFASTSAAMSGARRAAGLLVILGLVLVGELRPIFTSGSRDSSGITMSTMFSFAALLFFGLPGAARRPGLRDRGRPRSSTASSCGAPASTSASTR